MDKVKGKLRQAHILESAFKVFARYGFRKTSIEDLAKAADISRQGIYLHFKSKEEIFRACIQRKLDNALTASNQALTKENASLEDKLLDAFDEWFGRHAGLFHMETSDIIEQSRLMLGDTIDEYRASFQKTMVKTISESSSNKRKGKQVKLASEIVQTLFACGFGWKLELASREEFRERMKAAIKICCQNL